MRDAAARGSTQAPLDEAMPVTPSGDLPYNSYTHVDVQGRDGESPAEKTLRDGLNDHGRALEDLQKSKTPEQNQYPLDRDGDEDQ